MSTFLEAAAGLLPGPNRLLLTPRRDRVDLVRAVIVGRVEPAPEHRVGGHDAHP
ncbi:hypothetical protein [Kineococcus aurantiacus]|uniref:Uncharacterized protein n=1 Tax=Kineococcus aurantiacus TaxID=37633 RepID=A0A7Y9AS51_9ACTN|nr:hypothetical protein [Kineococcus aurantiacus]NYD20484.1 hypothetical protein [Kineococcus aurantiacus]